MKIYENRDNKYTVTCSYCRHTGHNKRHCPLLRKHWEQNKDYDGVSTSTLVGLDGSEFGGYWTVTNAQARLNFHHEFNYINDLMTSTPATPKKRRPSKCGFCGGEAHTRRTCSEMDEFVKILEETNRAYRKSFYDKVFVEYGIGIGAFVQYKRWWNDAGNATTLILDIDYDSISIGNFLNRWGSFHTTIKIGGRHSDNDKDFEFGNEFLNDNSFPLLSRDKMSHIRTLYGGITEVIAEAPSTPNEEWFLGHSPAFDWVVKNKSLRDLLLAYQGAIRKFHPDGEALWNKLREKL